MKTLLLVLGTAPLWGSVLILGAWGAIKLLLRGTSK